MKVKEDELLSLEMRSLMILNQLVKLAGKYDNVISDCHGNCSGSCTASCRANNANYFVYDCGGSCAGTCAGISMG